MRAAPVQGFTAACRASGAIEFAILAPVLLILATGCVGVAQLVRARTDVDKATATMAQLIATQTSVSPTQIGDFCQGARDELSPFPTAGLQLSVASVTRAAASGNAGVDWSDTSCGGGAAIAAPATLAAGVVTAAGDSAIVVQATYVFHNPLALVLPSVFTITTVAFARPRANTTVGHP